MSLAIEIASAGSSNGSTSPTGPKISSWAMVRWLPPPANTVGSTKKPLRSGVPPPATSVAPSSVPFAM